jgi:hypothetical protein
MEKRYRALRLIGTVYKVLGGIIGILTILGAIGVCLLSLTGGLLGSLGNSGRQLGALAGGSVAILGIVWALFIILYGGVIAVSLYGGGEGIYLLIALEENTRATVELLERQTKGGQTPGV